MKRMADVYSSASTVIVWLWPEAGDSVVAMQCCKEISTKVTLDWALGIITPSTTETHWADALEELPFSETRIIAVPKLLKRDWFKRLWIWQEICPAKSAVVMCGVHSIGWIDVRKAVVVLHIKEKLSVYLKDRMDINHFQLVLSLAKMTQGLSSVELIEGSKWAICTEPRDRIFALLSLIPGWESDPPPPPKKSIAKNSKKFSDCWEYD